MQRGTNLDDGAGLAGEVSADAPGKRVFRGVACSPEAKPAPSGTAGNTVAQCRLKPCTGKPFEVTDELELESQKGNSGLKISFTSLCARRKCVILRAYILSCEATIADKCFSSGCISQ